MTEDEAKTKWCPHAVASHTDPRAQTGYQREELGLPADTFLHACIGSGCMAWRWLDGDAEMFAVRLERPAADQPQDHAPGAEWSYVGPHQHNSRHTDNNNHFWFKRPWVPGKRGGFCGLAGAPQ
jgi:hypothetical protein